MPNLRTILDELIFVELYFSDDLDDTEQRIKELMLGENEIRNIIVKTQNKEAKRNSQDEGHPFRNYCSCGRCHNADITASAILSAILKKLEG